MASVCFYISGHGFGHASRQFHIINVLSGRAPHVRILVRTAEPWRLPKWTVDSAFVRWLPGQCDTGVVQKDSLRLDARATARTAADFYSTFEQRVDLEVASVLKRHDIGLVIADVPPLACAAAAAAAVPCVVVGNFTWDWIYEGYATEFARAAADVLPRIRQAYAAATCGWRLPLHGGFETVPNVVDMPFVARPATRPRAEVLEALGIPAGRPIALVSFGGFGLVQIDWTSLDCLEGWTIVIDGPRGEHPAGVVVADIRSMYHYGLRYPDLVAAVDVVVTKPGYGIVSECIANDTAMLYTSRGHFVEYDVMVREMPRVLRCAFIPQDDLLAGRWRNALDRLHNAPPAPERPATDGAEVVADAIVRML